MKKLHKLVLKSYVGPFLLTFAISLFLLVMQFFWKYIDDLMGKGLGIDVLIELLFYASANVIPLALPLAILISSIMTFGALAEKNELTAMKSTGLSLFKIMKPLIVLMVIIASSAFYFTNYTWPKANFKMRILITDIQNQKPALAFPEGVFYDKIDGYSILINKKNDDQSLEDILIYDYTDRMKNNRKTIHAQKGRMKKSTDGNFAILILKNGVMYEDVESDVMEKSKHPFQKSYFDKASIKFDLSEFTLDRSNQDMYKSGYQMQNVFQLSNTIDSLQKNLKTRNLVKFKSYKRHFLSRANQPKKQKTEKSKNAKADSIASADSMNFTDSTFYLEQLSTAQKKRSYDLLASEIRNNKKVADRQMNTMKYKDRDLARHKVEWHRKFTLSVACIILFFIGAPLGAIIRRGGLGTPVVIATILYLIYYIISITGEKMSESGVLYSWWGMWMSSIVLFPLGIWITYKAAKDAQLVDKDAYFKLFQKIFNKNKSAQ